MKNTREGSERREREKGAREGSEKTLTYQRAAIARKIHFQSENGLFERKNDSKNICELSDDKKIISDLISIDVKIDIEGQKYNDKFHYIKLYIHKTHISIRHQ